MLQKWIDKSYDKHKSPNAQNEILQINALQSLQGIASDIAESGYYNIMADESIDASNIGQFEICICWVEKRVCEEYISLMQLLRQMMIQLWFASNMCCCM